MHSIPPASEGAESSLEVAIRSLDKHGYLFGLKLSRSLSPFLHEIVYEELGLNWKQLRLESDDVAGFLRLTRHPQFYGASVTMPNKVAIIPHLDELTDECRDVGACNTLFIRHQNGRRLLCGANTDVVGIRDSFIYSVQSIAEVIHGRPALVIGGGGAARSAVYALRRFLRTTEIYLINRDALELDALLKDCQARGFGADLRPISSIEEANSLDTPGAIVACVPDFEPQSEGERLARRLVESFLDRREKGAMLEMCYNPTPFTRLGAIAEAKGWQVILGTEALIWQGLDQDQYWTGQTHEKLPVERVRRAIAEKVVEASQFKL